MPPPTDPAAAIAATAAHRTFIQAAINAAYAEMLDLATTGTDPLTALASVHARHFARYQAATTSLPSHEAALERALRRHNAILRALLATRTALRDQLHYAGGLWRELQAARAACLPEVAVVAHWAAWRWECAAREWVRLRGVERGLVGRGEVWEGRVRRRRGRVERVRGRGEVGRRVCRALRRRLREVEGRGDGEGEGESSGGSSGEESEEESEDEEGAGEGAGEGAA